VVVDIRDGSIPAGFTVTTPAAFGIDLDSAYQSTPGVSVLTADFGFAPALVATKQRVGSGSLREGQFVAYTIPVTNRLAGDGSSTSRPARYTVWPKTGTTGSSNQAWNNATYAWSPGEPDGRYAFAQYSNNAEWIRPAGYSYGAQLGAITNVTLIIPIQVTAPFQDSSTLIVKVEYGPTATIIFTQTLSCQQLSTGTLALDITAARANWLWSDFNGSLLAVELRSNKAKATLGVDSVGFRLTTSRIVGGTDDTTLNPVPLVDAYDTTRLHYVSSTPAADTVTTNVTAGEIRWNNLGPIYAGGGRLVTVMFKVLEPPGNITTPVTNTAAITNAWFANGLRANDQYGTNIATVLPAGTIGDRV
jgi:hypothetical protein